jgi:glycosyltransferase involved in cell wall biosynthesis
MSLTDSLALFFWALTAFHLLFIVRDLLRYDLRLAPIDDPAGEHGLVTVVIPMRNEEGNVRTCLEAVHGQSYRNLEVVVVNDGSTDGTAEILAEYQRNWPSLRVISIEGGPPPGWAGKTHAVHQGVQEAQGEWLLFIDADVILGEHAVATAVGSARRNDWPVLSLNGHLVLRSFWDLTLLLPVGILTHLFHVEMPCTVLNGQFILIRRSVYRESGGFAAIRGAVVEDAVFASRLAECGYRPRVRVWPEAYRCRMYTSLAGMWLGLTRILAGYNRFRASQVMGSALIYSTVLLPQAVLLWLLLGAIIGRPVSMALAAASSSLVAVHVVSSLIIAHTIGAPIAAVLLKPIADLNVMAVLLDSARRAAFGGVMWRGRSYTDAPLPARKGSTRAPELAPQEASTRMSLVVPLEAGAVSGEHSFESVLDRANDLLRQRPEIEVVGVVRGEMADDPEISGNVRLLRTRADSYWDMVRSGCEASSAPLVAVLDATANDPAGWSRSMLAAFDDPDVNLAAGTVHYDDAGAMALAASIREWGHLSDPWTAYPSPGNFAGRRELLLRILPIAPEDRAQGGIVLGMLAAIEGSSFQVIPEASAGVSARLHPIVASMAARLAAATSLTARAARWADRRPSLTRLGVILMPLTVWADTALLTLRVLPTWLARTDVPPLCRTAVLLWLNLLGALDFALAVTLVVRSSISRRRVPIGDLPNDRAAWQHRVLGIVHRMLASPRHRRAPSGLVAIG